MGSLTLATSTMNAIARLVKVKVAKKAKATIVLKVEDIRLFTESSKGSGRGSNDKHNKLREEILKLIHSESIRSFLTDETYGAAWAKLQEQFVRKVHEIGHKLGYHDYSNFKTVLRGGRKCNWDIDCIYTWEDRTKTEHIEFKYGGMSIDSVSQYFNAAANKPFHTRMYADFMYDNYMNTLCTLVGIPESEKPTKDLYLKHIHKNTSRLAFFQRLKDMEEPEDATERPNYSAKSDLVKQSIRDYLVCMKDTTNLAAIAEEIQRSQTAKHFLLYSNGDFHYDCFESAELCLKRVVGIKGGNTLVLQSEKPTTYHMMLLRWKNHLGVLYPAWQISMRRNCTDPECDDTVAAAFGDSLDTLSGTLSGLAL